MNNTPSRASFARIGLAYLENAILDALGEYGREPGDVASDLGLYPDVRDHRNNDQLSGNALVRAILISLEREGRVVASEHGTRSWKLTKKERRLRRDH